MSKKINKVEYPTLDDLITNDTEFEKALNAEIDFEVRLIGKLIEAREKKGLSQKQLAELCGVKQPAIARLESIKSTPQINTLFKILTPLGYKLDIVPIK